MPLVVLLNQIILGGKTVYAENKEQNHPNYRQAVAERIEEGNRTRENQLVSYGYDLVEVPEHHPTCERCAIFQGRVYSISGNDKRFPPLSVIYEEGTHRIHKNCRHVVVGWVEGAYTPQEIEEVIRRSNRPFVDPRSEEEKKLFNTLHYKFFVGDVDRMNYEKLKELLPEITPKTLYGYRRMKKPNTKNYRKIVEAAKEVGLDIDKYRYDSEDDVLDYDEIIEKVKEFSFNMDYYI